MEFEVVNPGDNTKSGNRPCPLFDHGGCPFPKDMECWWPEDICYRPEPI